MKNLRLLIRISLILAFVSSILPSPAYSTTYTYTFSPSPGNLGELDHNDYYIWGIKWNLPSGQTITGATLTYNNIYDWAEETNHLYTYLLNTVTDPNGSKKPPNWVNKGAYSTITITGNEGGGDKFAGEGHLLGDWSDPHGGSPSNFDLVYTIPYFSWLSDGNFGFGIDPDCHYYDGGITCEITTTDAVPEPASLLLLGSGLIGLGAFAKKRFSKK